MVFQTNTGRQASDSMRQLDPHIFFSISSATYAIHRSLARPGRRSPERLSKNYEISGPLIAKNSIVSSNLRRARSRVSENPWETFG